MPYYHIVFTLPAAIADIAYQNKAVVYDLLFKASAETMLTGELAVWVVFFCRLHKLSRVRRGGRQSSPLSPATSLVAGLTRCMRW